MRRFAPIVSFVTVGLAASPFSASAAEAIGDPTIWTIEGCAGVLAQVVEAGTGNPIGGARVSIEPRNQTEGAPADSATSGSLRSADLRPLGRTSAEGTIILPPPGARRIVVSSPGWESASVEMPCTDAITVLEVSLKLLPPERSPLASAGGDAHRVVGGESLERMAGVSRNVFQAVQTMPGVARPTFQNMILGSILGAGDLGVRGARAAESRTFLDGIEIPYFYHYLGFSSVVPAEMVEVVDFVPSGAGPQFGRLTGGVLDIHSRALRGDDDDQPWHGRANLQLWEGNAIARGPVAGGQLSLSDRSSIWDHLLKRKWGEGIPVWSYNDFQAVYKKPLSHGAEVSALAIGSFDDVRLADNETPTHMRTEFYRVGSSFRAKGEGSKLQLAASWGFDKFHVTIRDPEQGLQLSSLRKQNDLRVAADGEFELGGRLPLRAGIEAHAVEPTAGLRGDVQQQEWIIFDRTYTDRGWWSAAWTELEVRPDERVVIIPGVRADYDSFVGSAWVDPRMTVRWFVGSATSLSASGGFYKKPHPFSLAFADNRKLGLTEGSQVSGGVEQKVFDGGLVLDARVYHSTFENQVQGWEWIPDFDEYGNSITGDGRSYGAELWGRFEAGKNTGAFGYSFSRTEWKNLSTDRQWTASDQDATHAVSLVVNRRMRKNWNGGLRVRWYSGLPYTYYDAAVFVPDADSYVGVGENPYAKRAPSYFQMDVRMTKRWQPSSRLAIEAFLDIQNVTNRQNVDGYGAEGNPSSPTPNMALPIFPSIGVSVVF